MKQVMHVGCVAQHTRSRRRHNLKVVFLASQNATNLQADATSVAKVMGGMVSISTIDLSGPAPIVIGNVGYGGGEVAPYVNVEEIERFAAVVFTGRNLSALERQIWDGKTVAVIPAKNVDENDLKSKIGGSWGDVTIPYPADDIAFEAVRAAVEREASEARLTCMSMYGNEERNPAEPIASIQVYEKLAVADLAQATNPAAAAWERMDVAEAVKVTRGKSIKVAVLDTGCRGTHPSIVGRVRPAIDATGTGGGTTDRNGHGTFVCSQILSDQPPGAAFGIGTEVDLYPIQVLHAEQGWGSDSWIARGVDAAVKLGCHVVSMSLGGPDEMPQTLAALQRAESAGVVVVAAAGNDGPGAGNVSFPARYSECIAVGACDDSGRTADFSQRGPDLDIIACGVAQVGAVGASGYGRWSGTSMATPHVASAAALFVAAFGEVAGRKPHADEVLRHLVKTAADGPGGGGSGEARWGIVQMGKAIGSVPVVPVDPPKPTVPNIGTIDYLPTVGGVAGVLAELAKAIVTHGTFTVTVVQAKQTPNGWKRGDE